MKCLYFFLIQPLFRDQGRKPYKNFLGFLVEDISKFNDLQMDEMKKDTFVLWQFATRDSKEIDFGFNFSIQLTMFLKCFHSVIASYSCLLSIDRFCDTKKFPRDLEKISYCLTLIWLSYFPRDRWKLLLPSITKPIHTESFD